MSAPFRWGILGPGKIAHKFAHSLPFAQDAVLEAVASQTPGKAREFATEFRVPNAFNQYTELLNSGLVDAVYIATTNQTHLENILLAIEADVPVLCEKPLTASVAQTQLALKAAKNRGIFLMEGLWSVFLPHIGQAWKWIEAGEIGTLLHVTGDFGYKAPDNMESRLFNPSLGGGVALDVGIYPISLFYKTLGPLEDISATGTRARSGVDDHIVFQGNGKSGATFQGMVSFRMQSSVEAVFFGSEGSIRLSSQWLRPTSAVLKKGNAETVFAPVVSGFGFQFEANETMACIRSGLSQSAAWSHSDSLLVASYIEQIQLF